MAEIFQFKVKNVTVFYGQIDPTPVIGVEGDIYLNRKTTEVFVKHPSFGWIKSAGEDIGPIGYTGSAGQRGEIGYAGSSGMPGQQGFTGSQGIPGVGFTGSRGNSGFTGSKGLDGTDGTSFVILGSLTNISELPASGNTVGDCYIIAGDLHVWNGTSWVNAGQIQGPLGFTGSRGFNGSTGFAGSAGLQGNSGFTGSQGVGFVGSRGNTGFTGSKGDQGVGFTGSKGDSYAIADVQTIYAATDPGNVLGVKNSWDSMKGISLLYASTITMDFTTGINFMLSLNGNTTFGNPINKIIGKTGIITITQTGNYTVSWGSNWVFKNGPPVMPTTPNSVAVIPYYIESSSIIRVTMV